MTAMPSAEELRWRTAHHESGHTVAMIVVGMPLEAVSIRPGKHFGGIAHPGDLRTWQAEIPPTFGTVPSVALPADFRKAWERRIVVSLAGELAARWAVPLTGFIPSPAEDFAERAAAALARLSPRHAELIVAAESADPTPSDEESAASDSYALVGPEESAAHLNWLRVVAGELVREWACEISALGAALLERPVLSGDEAKGIVRSARPYLWRPAADAVPA